MRHGSTKFAMRYLNAERAQLSSPNEWVKFAVSRTKPNSNQIAATIDICAVEKWRNCTLRSIFRAWVFHRNGNVKIESSVDCWTRRRARNFMNRFCNFKCRRVIACCTFCSCIAWNWIDHKFSCIVLKVRVNPIIQLQHHHHRSASARSTRRLRWLKLNRTTKPNWNLFNSRQESNDRAIFLMFLTVDSSWQEIFQFQQLTRQLSRLAGKWKTRHRPATSTNLMTFPCHSYEFTVFILTAFASHQRIVRASRPKPSSLTSRSD